MSAASESKITQQAIAAYMEAPGARQRELLTALVEHLHAFASQTRLTQPEWHAAIEFLTATGRTCDASRQEFILLSDVLGLSSLVEEVNAAEGSTESTILGPFYVPGAPARAPGEQIGRPEDGSPVLVRGQVTDLVGAPVASATIDIWQASGNGFYDTQDPRQPPFNLRGVFSSGADGRYEFRAARPVSYPIPTDGPVGDLLRAVGRPHWRAAHIHAIVSAPGFASVTTHIFDADCPHLGNDAVFGVRNSLVREFRAAGQGDPPDVDYVVDMDFALAPATSAGTSQTSS